MIKVNKVATNEMKIIMTETKAQKERERDRDESTVCAPPIFLLFKRLFIHNEKLRASHTLSVVHAATHDISAAATANNNNQIYSRV